jgi:hypothetical protein
MKTYKKFHSNVRKYLCSIGATRENPIEDTERSQYVLDTKVGKLDITLHSDSEKYSVASIFTRFQDIGRVNKSGINFGGALNPHSGKWNFHFADENECLEHFKNCIDKILIK